MDQENQTGVYLSASAQPLKERVQELNRQAVAAFLQQMQGVEELCQQALTLSAPHGIAQPDDLIGAAEALQTLGRLSMVRCDFGKALDSFQKSLALYEQSGGASEIALSRSYLGVAFVNLGDYSRAAELLRHALREAENASNTVLAAQIMNDLSYNYVLAGEPELALQNLLRSIDILREAGDELSLSWALDSLGQAYLMVGQKEKALDCVMESMELVSRLEIRRDIPRAKQSVGEMYRAMGDVANALEVFQEALLLSRQYGLRGDECSALFSIADLYQLDGRYTEALPLLNEAVAIAAQTGIKPHLRQCCLLLSRVYKSLGDFPKALEYHERFYEIDREIFNAETDQRLRSVQALYQLETARKEAELYQLRAQALQLEVEERRRTAAILERAASTDSLTDLLNRRAFFDLAERAFVEALMTNQHLAVILIDVDHFKDVNDTFGHLVGDQSLALIADRLHSNIRAGDKIARYGGEEFIVLLPGVDSYTAFTLADRLRSAISSSPVKTRGVSVPVSISLGVAGMDPESPCESIDQLIAQADIALYKAKDSGRNTTFTFSVE